MRNPLDFALENSKLGRVDEIISEIDREQWRANFFQVRPGIIIMRGFERVEHVIGVVGFQDVRRRICRELRPFLRGWALLFVAPNGLLLINQSISAAVRRLGGWVLYSPPFHAGSPRIASMITRRQERLRPEICVGKTRQRQECVHELRMRFAPEPRMHSAHRRPHHQARVIHAQAFGE